MIEEINKFLCKGNHQFILKVNIENIGMAYECVECKYMLVFTNGGVYFVPNMIMTNMNNITDFPEKMLSCEECVIKNIIE